MKQTACVCSVVIAFCAGSACIATKQGYVSKGNKFYAAGKFKEASLNYLKAIQKDPNFGEAYYRLGLAAIKENQATEAYESLLRAVQLVPTNLDAKEKFADVSLLYYLTDPKHPNWLYNQLKQLSDEFLSKNPNSYEGVMLKGYLASSDRKSTEAIGFFRRALRINPSNAGVTAELVRLLIENGQAPEAEKLAKDLIAREQTYGPVYDQLYELYSTSGRPVDAENILKAKGRNNPKNADYILQLARYYFRHQNVGEMHASLQQLLGDPKDFPRSHLWVGDFYVELKDYPQALRYYQDGLSASNNTTDRITYQKRVAISLLALGKKDEAQLAAAKAVRMNPQDGEALHLHGDLLLASGKPENADTAIQEFHTLSEKNPADARLRLQLGRAYRLKGDLSAARDQFRAALNKQNNLIEAKYELAELSLGQMRAEDALQQASEILKSRPNDIRARLLYARGLMDLREFVKARAELTRLIKDAPQFSEAQLQLGALTLIEGKPKEAIPIFNKLLTPGEPRAYAGLATCYSLLGEMYKARDIVDEGLKKSPGSPILIQQLAGIQAVSGNYDGALAQFRLLLAKEPKSIELMQRMADIYERKGDSANAILLYQQASELAPGDTNIALTLGDMLARAGRSGEAKRRYEGIIGAHPENAGALNNLAFLLADTGGDLDEALRLAQRALAKAPNQRAFSDTVGYVYLKKGLNDSAVQIFFSLVRKDPHFAPFRYHLGMALFVKGDKAGAKRELQTALADKPSLQDQAKIKELLARIS